MDSSMIVAWVCCLYNLFSKIMPTLHLLYVHVFLYHDWSDVEQIFIVVKETRKLWPYVMIERQIDANTRKFVPDAMPEQL